MEVLHSIFVCATTVEVTVAAGATSSFGSMLQSMTLWFQEGDGQMLHVIGRLLMQRVRSVCGRQYRIRRDLACTYVAAMKTCLRPATVTVVAGLEPHAAACMSNNSFPS